MIGFVCGNMALKTRCLFAGGILLPALGMSFAVADQFDTVNYSASAGVNYDSNVFRLPSTFNTQQAFGSPLKSDRVQLLTAGVSVDKGYSNQTVHLSARLSNNQYSHFTNLNYNASNYKAALSWELTSKFTGSVSDERTQTLNNFADAVTRTNVRNIRNTDTRSIHADWWAQSSWHVLFGVTDSLSSNTLATVNNTNNRGKTGEWGVRYIPTDKTSVLFTVRNSRVSYTDANFAAQYDGGYVEKQEELQMSWHPTGKSDLLGTITNTQRTHPVLRTRDFSGLQGGLNYDLLVSDKAQLNTSFHRVLNGWFDTVNNYFITDTISISPKWQISSHVDAHLGLMRSLSSYKSIARPNLTTRQDVNKLYELGVGWSPRRALTFNAALQHSLRTSNLAAYEFSDNTASFSVSGSF